MKYISSKKQDPLGIEKPENLQTVEKILKSSPGMSFCNGVLNHF